MDFTECYEQIVLPTYQDILNRHLSENPDHTGEIAIMGNTHRLNLAGKTTKAQWSCEIRVIDHTPAPDEPWLSIWAFSHLDNNSVIGSDKFHKFMSPDNLHPHVIKDIMQTLRSSIERAKQEKPYLA